MTNARALLMQINNSVVLQNFDIEIKSEFLKINGKEISLAYVPKNLLNIFAAKFFPSTLQIVSEYAEKFISDSSLYQSENSHYSAIKVLIKKHFQYSNLFSVTHNLDTYFKYAEKPAVLFGDPLSCHLYRNLIDGIFLKSQFDFLINLLSLLKNKKLALSNLSRFLVFKNGQWWLDLDVELAVSGSSRKLTPAKFNLFRATTSKNIGKQVSIKENLASLCESQASPLVSFGNESIYASPSYIKVLRKKQSEFEDLTNSFSECVNIFFSNLPNLPSSDFTPGDKLDYNDAVGDLLSSRCKFDSILEF